MRSVMLCKIILKTLRSLRFETKNMSAKKIAFFASGSGSNMENIVSYLRAKNLNVEFLLLCNNPQAFVLERAKKMGIEAIVFDKIAFRETGEVFGQLKTFQPDLIVLAGFLWLMPAEIVQAFPNKIINIHPALLPNYGGKGMYGMNVHNAVVQNKESESGITIHFVNEHYDEGKYILQASCKLNLEDTPDTVAHKVHLLEYEHFPKVVDQLVNF
jgi:phosphoribosylglycinamide formyltransferase-1